MDTVTRHTLAWALHALAANPGQWAALRDDPSLSRAATEETLRHASPVQTFFRTTTCDAEVAGTTIPAGQKVLLFLGAANRDPRAWPDPGRFDISRRAAGHVDFGSGIHACVGAAIARLEGEYLLSALARQVSTLTLAGPVRPHLNNTARLAELPLDARRVARPVAACGQSARWTLAWSSSPRSVALYCSSAARPA